MICIRCTLRVSCKDSWRVHLNSISNCGKTSSSDQHWTLYWLIVQQVWFSPNFIGEPLEIDCTMGSNIQWLSSRTSLVNILMHFIDTLLTGYVVVVVVVCLRWIFWRNRHNLTQANNDLLQDLYNSYEFSVVITHRCLQFIHVFTHTRSWRLLYQ